LVLGTPKKLNLKESMEMSFFISCPLTGGLSVPRPKTGTGSGPGNALLVGHEIKKDISMLNV